ncbi:hypothetical protein L551_3214 [Bordetella pertussis STO1-SEAT-0004]|uniref:hypothetical protein n=1 Tax=Bordetella pertussis TaxID=520 RepID=UPI0003D3EF72|nr:hypothetical protein [Bordetella pertussis]ETI03802.1 hypothetical protein L551_3214 [Bordetella pertussis STO1-SEAT-0004]
MHGSSEPDLRKRCTHLQTQPGRIQPIDSSQLAGVCPSHRNVPEGAHAQRLLESHAG